jgi:hypothetical protein
MQALMTKVPYQLRPHQNLSLDNVGLDRADLKPDHGVKDNLLFKDAAKAVNE